MARLEVMDVNGSGGTTLDYIMGYDDQINYARIYGLYKYGAVYGSIVVLFNIEHDRSTEEVEMFLELYNDARYINSLLFSTD